MNRPSARLIVSISLFVLVSIACNFPSVKLASPDKSSELENNEPDSGEEISAQSGDLSENEEASSEESDIPEPTITLTPTAEPPMAWVTQNTNCRAGPNKIYDNLGALLQDEKTEIVGIGSTGYYYIVMNPDLPGGECWLWDKYAVTSGDLSILPEMTPPPSPTPAFVIDFQADVSQLHSCGGNVAINYSVTNTGDLDFESAWIKLVDLDTSNTLVAPTQTNAPFVSSNVGCPPGNSALSSSGTAYIPFITALPLPNPIYSHTLRADIKLCTKDGLGEPCLTKTIEINIGSPSDEALKTNLTQPEQQKILDKVIGLDIYNWNYLSDDPSVQHIGPMAQDFFQAFEVGDDDTHIYAIDADGVALASIQALHEQIQTLESRLDEIEQKFSLQSSPAPWWSIPFVLAIGILIGLTVERKRTKNYDPNNNNTYQPENPVSHSGKKRN